MLPSHRGARGSPHAPHSPSTPGKGPAPHWPRRLSRRAGRPRRHPRSCQRGPSAAPQPAPSAARPGGAHTPLRPGPGLPPAAGGLGRLGRAGEPAVTARDSREQPLGPAAGMPRPGRRPPPGATAHQRFCPSSSSLGSSAPPGPSGPSSFFSTSTGAILPTAATKSDLTRARRGPRSSLSPARLCGQPALPAPPRLSAAAPRPPPPAAAPPLPAAPLSVQAAPGQPRQRSPPWAVSSAAGVAAAGSAPWCPRGAPGEPGAGGAHLQERARSALSLPKQALTATHILTPRNNCCSSNRTTKQIQVFLKTRFPL